MNLGVHAAKSLHAAGQTARLSHMQQILVHYGELGLKGKNRIYFEQKLAQNIRRLLSPRTVERQFGRMLFGFEAVDEALLERLTLIPGIRHFALIHTAKPELEDISEVAEQAVLAAMNGNTEGISFGVSAQRSDKRFPLTSPELSREVGTHLHQSLGLRVNLDAPDVPVRIEVCKHAAYISTRKLRGIGGLPVGSSGRGVVLLSGGIDSPVAAYSMMKRGLEVILVHLYNSSINRDFAKIEALTARISLFQPRVRLYLIDLEEFQRNAIAHVPAKYRMILYKRQMIRTAASLAAREKAEAIVTGDSLGQVASQTLGNISAIYDVCNLPLLSPLIGFDKEEIIALGRKIGTYDISTEEYCDICSYLIAKHPETRASKVKVATYEQALPTEGLEQPTRIETFVNGEQRIPD